MPEKGYESVSLPSELLDLVRAFLKEYPDRGYGSMSEYVKEAVRGSLLSDETFIYRRSLEESIVKKHGKTPYEIASGERRIGTGVESEPRDAADRVLRALAFAIHELPADAEILRPALEGIRRSLSRLVVRAERARTPAGRRFRESEPVK
jgi:Arc/MetJ-type ribon-helix-helix transcriptional regulator